MRRTTVFSALTSVALCATAIPASANTPPTKGLYATQSYISSESPSCQNILSPAGATIYGFFDYPGPNASGALLRYPFVGKSSTGVYNYVQLLGFPTTPATGKTTWTFMSSKFPAARQCG